MSFVNSTSIPLKRAARYLVGKLKAALRFRRQKHVDKITVFVYSDFAGDPVLRKSTTGLVALRQILLHQSVLYNLQGIDLISIQYFPYCRVTSSAGANDGVVFHHHLLYSSTHCRSS